MPRRSPRKFTEDEKKGTLEVAAAQGPTAASRLLDIDKHSIYRWAAEYPEYWSELKAGNRDAQKLGIAARLEDLADNYAAVEFDALERAEKLVKTANPKELAALVKALGASRGVATAGARGYRGEDSQHVDIEVNFPQIEAAAASILEKAGPQQALVVDNLEESS